MPEHKIRVEAELDTDKAKKKLDELTKENKKIKIEVDDSSLDKGKDKLKDTKINVRTNVDTKGVDSLSNDLKGAKKSADDLSKSFSDIFKVGAQIDVFRMIKQEAKEAVKAVKEIDDAIVDLQMATSDSYDGVRKLVSGYNSLAKQLGATTTEITSGADDWLRQGKSISETNKLIRDSMILSKDAKIAPEDSTSYLTAIMKGYDIAVDKVSSISDSLSSIDLVSAVDAKGLAEATSRVAASADLAGVSLNKLLGYEAAIGEASQESMSVIGNSLKTIFARMSDIKADKLELVDTDGTVEKLSDVETTLANVGIDLRKTINEYNSYGDVLDNLAQKWDGLNDAQQKAISKAFSGQRQANRFQLLMANYDKAMEYTKIAENSQGTALRKFEDAYLNSLEAKQKSLQASFESLATNTISRDTYSGIVEATQALVDFLNQTNLVKGAIAGVTIGGLTKGFLSITTGITQATIKMQNFQKALNLLKTGNVATDGIQKLTQYTDGLSKSQLKAVLSSTQLTTAQRLQILTSTGMSEAEAKATLATLGLSVAEKTATASTLSLSTAMKGLFSTLLANPIFLVGAAVTAGVSMWQSYKQSIESAVSSTSEAGNVFQENYSTLQEQISKVQELKTALASGTLSEEDAYQAKSQLLDIQNQLVGTYGNQAAGIDLVNGSLEKEIALMNELSIQKANEYLNENKKGIDKSTKEMEEERKMYLGEFSKNGENGKEIQDIIDKYAEKGIFTDEYEAGMLTIHFKGDADEAEKTLNDFMTDVRKLSEGTGDDYGVLDGIIAKTSTGIEEANKVLDKYQDTYNTSLQADMVSKGFGQDKPATILKEYADAIEEYNSALSSGDASEIDKAKTAFDDVKSSVDGVLQQYPQYQSLFDQVGDSLNETAIKAKDFKDALSGDRFKDTVSQFKDLQDVDLKSISFDDDLIANGEDALRAVVDKAIELGVVSDDSSESISKVVDMLVDLGYTGTQSTTILADSFEKANTSIQKSSANMAKLKDIMSESVSGAGISAENVKVFREMFGSEAESALEKTATGYHLNEKALAQLQKRQEEMTKTDYLSALSDQQEALQKIDEQIAKALFNGEDISGLQVQRSGIESQIETLQDLQYQYEAATSAYQQWQNAMSGGEEGDQYDAIFAEKEKAKELYDKGLTGTNEFKTYTDLLSSEDLSDASVEQIVSAYERLGQTINGTTHNAMEFATEGQEGCFAFLDAVSQLNSDWAHMSDDGTWQIDFGVGNDKEIADALGIDVEYLQSILRKLSDYGFEIELDQPVASLEELKTSAQTAKESLEGMQDTGLSDINLDSSSFGEVTNNIDKVKEYIQTVNESDLEPEVKTEKLEYANDILEYLVGKQQETSKNIRIEVNAEELESKIAEAKNALDSFKKDEGTIDLSVEGATEAVDNLQALLYQKEQLNSPAVMSVDTGQVDGELGNAIAKIKEYQSAVQELNVQNALQAQGVDIDTSAAEEKVQSLAGEIQAIDPNITATLGIDTSSVASLQSSISAITPEVLIKAGVDTAAIAGYMPEDKSSTVKFEVDSSAVDVWSAPDKNGTVTYRAIWDIGNPPVKTQYVEIIETKRATGTMLSMKSHASGTLKAHVNGRVALPRDERALVNELGTESRIRDGVWETIPGGMHVENLKKGDIIINAKQTEELIKHGKVSGTGGMSAYSRGTGKFNLGGSGSAASSGSGNTYIDNSTTNNNLNVDSDTEELKPEKFDWIEKLLSRIQRAITKLGKVATSTFKPWKERTDALGEQISKVTEEMSKQQEAYDRYMQEAESVGLSEEYKNKIKDGTIDIESITDEDLKEKIKEFEKWYDLAIQCEDAVQDLDEELSNLTVQKFDNVVQQYEDKLSVIEHRADMLDESMNQTEDKGYIVGSSYYKAAIEENQSYLELLEKQRSDLKETLDAGVASGRVAQYSEEWYNLMGQIYDVDVAIKDTDGSIVALNKDLRELDWSVFDRLQNMISGIQSESDFMIKLMSNDKMFDEETGAITEQGMATLGSHAVNYNAYMAQSEEYGKEIKEINRQLAEDPYNIDLLERREELIDSQRDMISAAEDEKQSMKDLVSDGYDVFLDVLEKSIKKRKELMDISKDLYDFEKKISKQSKEVADLEKMLQVYNGDTSEETKTIVQQLKVQLEEARENLEESQYDKYISDQEQILDQLYSEAEVWINSRLDNLDGLVQGVIDSTNENAESIKETLQNEADSVGIKLSESMNNIWSTNGDGYGSVVTTYCEGFTNKLTTTNATLDQIRLFIAEMVAKADADAKNDIDNQNNQHESDTSDPTPPVTPTPTPPAQEQPSKEVSVGGLIDAGGAKIYAHPGGEGYTQYFANDPIYTVLAEKDGYVQVRWHNTPDGVTGWFNKSDIKAYKKGGLVDYTGLAQLDGTPSEPEMVLNAEDTKNFMDLKDALVTYTKDGRKLTPIDPSKLDPNFYKAIQSGELMRSLMPNNLPVNYTGISGIDNLPVPNSNVQIQQGDIHIGDIQMYGVQDPQEFAKQLRYTLVNDRQTTKIIQAKTVGAMAGRGSLEATKYMF